jgi:ketosteroid isomerase-like protein
MSQPVPERLHAAINAHDLDGVVACFAADFDSRHPAHPNRAFRGADQVRANWSQIFASVPDLSASLVRTAQDGGTVWAEWEWSGTRRDGAPHLMRGVTVLGVDEHDRIAWTNFYMELVRSDGADTPTAIREAVGPGAPS